MIMIKPAATGEVGIVQIKIVNFVRIKLKVENKLVIVQLGPSPNPSLSPGPIGPKLIIKVTFNTNHHPPPKTFMVVPGKEEG